jgi:hypothetical protein
MLVAGAITALVGGELLTRRGIANAAPPGGGSPAEGARFVAPVGLPGAMVMGEGPMMGDGSMILLPLLFKTADLSADQESKLKQSLASHRDTFKSLFAQLHAANGELAAKIVAPGELHSEDLDARVGKIVDLRKQMIQEGLKVALEARALLTDDQLTKLSQTRQQLESLHDQMRALLGGKDVDL